MARKIAALAGIAVASLYRTSIGLAVPAVPGLVEAGIGFGGPDLERELVGRGSCEAFYH